MAGTLASDLGTKRFESGVLILADAVVGRPLVGNTYTLYVESVTYLWIR